MQYAVNLTQKGILDKKLEYRFDHKRKITFEKVRGQISFNDLAAYEKSKFSDPEYNDSYAIIADIRGAVFDISKYEIIRIYKFIIKSTTKISMKGKFAFIANTPNEVVAAELFRVSLARFGPAVIQIFTTEEAALHWITNSWNVQYTLQQ